MRLQAFGFGAWSSKLKSNKKSKDSKGSTSASGKFSPAELEQSVRLANENVLFAPVRILRRVIKEHRDHDLAAQFVGHIVRATKF